MDLTPYSSFRVWKRNEMHLAIFELSHRHRRPFQKNGPKRLENGRQSRGARTSNNALRNSSENPQWDRTELLPGMLQNEETVEMRDQVEKARQLGLQEYEDLKKMLLKRTWRFGTLFAGYLLLTVSTEAAFAELVGAIGGYGYFLWLMKDVDSLSKENIGPYTAFIQRKEERNKDSIKPSAFEWIAKIVAAYRMSLNPRLLILIGLVVATQVWNYFFQDEYHLGMVEKGCLVGGFLSYKMALILKIYDDLKPRALTEEEMLQASRPKLVEIDDVQFEFPNKTREPEQEEKPYEDEVS